MISLIFARDHSFLLLSTIWKGLLLHRTPRDYDTWCGACHAPFRCNVVCHNVSLSCNTTHSWCSFCTGSSNDAVSKNTTYTTYFVKSYHTVNYDHLLIFLVSFKHTGIGLYYWNTIISGCTLYLQPSWRCGLSGQLSQFLKMYINNIGFGELSLCRLYLLIGVTLLPVG